MKQVVIENPVVNSPFSEPERHFKFSQEGITKEIERGRRESAYFVPVAQPRKGGVQLTLETEWTLDRIKANKFINKVREQVSVWRRSRRPDEVTKTTLRLLDYWTRPDRERKLFFCQIEAVETAIYLTEVANKRGQSWFGNELTRVNTDANPGLYRTAFKMATGSGKTVVMAMLIAWHVLNKVAHPQDTRFSDAFLVVTPGITIRDRLRVLLPNDPGNYYHSMDLVPPDLLPELEKSKITITNFHGLMPKETQEASKLTKSLLNRGRSSAFTETPDQMVRRVCRDLGTKKNIVVLNDEAHHCYRRRAEEEVGKLTREERKEAEEQAEKARVWVSGLEAINTKIGLRAVYDLSATPFFLRGSGYPEGTLFPWVVSDFSLIDAIESGIVKVPRVPVADDSMTGRLPTYRDLWLRIRDHLPRKGRGKEALKDVRTIPKELEGALTSLYGNYEKYYRSWRTNTEAREKGLTPPVFIAVCNNTNVSKLVYDYIGGWEKTGPDGAPVVIPGKLSLFSNESHGQWLSRPNTILVDSEQLESGEPLSEEFKRVAAEEISMFKEDYARRFPGREVEDSDILREVMNTVGKPGKLGEHVRCVVSVSMLSEGWDANTVTHILGVRAFGTQLLCEQVVGRGLRRMSYATKPTSVSVGGSQVDFEAFPAEYAEVYGVPFSFIPCSGSATDPKPGPLPTRVHALEDRLSCEITFPRLLGYRYDLPSERLTAKFTESSKMILSTTDLPTRTENAPILGESSMHTLDDLKARREQEVAFKLAVLVLDKYLKDKAGNAKPWLFPQILEITKGWLSECLVCKDNMFPQLLLMVAFAHTASDHIYKSIVSSTEGEKAILPILRPYDTVGSTRTVDFDTIRSVYRTRAEKCHVSHVVGDTKSWEQKMAQTLEDMDEVIAYVKNDHLGFTVPYTLDGEEHDYLPDFIVKVRNPNTSPDLGTLNLIVEVTGAKGREKAAKVSTARALWVPAVNNHGAYGRWAFLETTDPWNAKNEIRKALRDGLDEMKGGVFKWPE